jgi:WD40 repeat protein
LLTADYEGNVVEWDVNNGETKGFTGAKHTNSVVQMQVQGRHLVTVALDDSIKITSLDDKKWGGSVGVGGAPSGVAVSKKSNGLAVIATNNSVVVVRDGKIASKEAIKFQATCVALSIDDSEVAVGGADNKIHIYTLSGDKLTAKTEYSNHRGAITRLQYSPNGKFLASCDANREVLVFENGQVSVITLTPFLQRLLISTLFVQPKVSGWVFHTARVNSLAWSPDSVHLATAGLDTNIIVWNIVETGSRILLKGAHSGGVKDLLWTDDNTIASVGQDCALKTWSLTF